MARDSTERGKIAIQEIQAQLREAISFKLQKLNEAGKKAPEIQRDYNVSYIDLHGIITGTGNVPLARIIMFAAALGYDMQFVMSEDSDKYETWQNEILKK